MGKISSKINSINYVKNNLNKLYEQNKTDLLKMSEKLDNYKMFLSNFFSMILGIGLDKVCNVDRLSNKCRCLYIVNSSNEGLCGNLNVKIFHEIELLKDKKNIDVFCIGKKSFKFFVEKGFNVVGYIKDGCEFFDFTVLFDLLDNSLVNYSQTKLMFNVGNKLSCTDLYSFEKSQVTEFIGYFGLNNDQDPLNDFFVEESIQKEFISQLSKYMIYGAYLLNKVEELKNRKNVLVRGSYRRNMRKIEISFSEKRQSLITQKIMELMSIREHSMV